MELEFPFVRDLVSNTLCADLLDYLERDAYFCGLRERSGDRVVRYVAVIRVEAVKRDTDGSLPSKTEEFLPCDVPGRAKGRAVLLAYRMEQQHVDGGAPKPVQKPDVISEAIDLLRRRFSLAEKVYFHRSKLAASAMLISAVGSSSIDLGTVRDLTDTQFLAKLKNDTNPRCKRLVDAYEQRRLYKPIYKVLYIEETDDNQQSKVLWREKYQQQFRDAKWRKQQEECLERYAGLAPGSAIIYCPDRQMNLKEFEMLVQNNPGAEIKKLEFRLDEVRKLEMEAINKRFAQLWSLIVFVDPDQMDVTEVSVRSDVNSGHQTLQATGCLA